MAPRAKAVLFLVWIILGTPVLSAILGESCTKDSDCTPKKSVCKTENGIKKCACVKEWNPAPSNPTQLCYHVTYGCSYNKGVATASVSYEPAVPSIDTYTVMRFLYAPIIPECQTNTTTEEFDKTNTGVKFKMTAVSSDADCGLKVDTTEGKKTVSFAIELREDPRGMYAGRDVRYLLLCKYEATVSSSTSIGIQGTDVFKPTVIQEVMNLYLVSDNAEILSACALQQTVRLRLQAQESITAKGFRILNCQARPTLDSETTIDLIVDSCGAGQINSVQGFRQVGGKSATGIINNESPHFKCFSFEGTNTLIISCEVTFCTQSDQDWCVKDHCKNREPTRRRRASASERPANIQTIVFQYSVRNEQVIQFFPTQRDMQEDCSSQTGSCVSEEQNCWQSIPVLSVLAGLSLMLLTSLSVTLFIYFRARQSKDKTKTGTVQFTCSHVDPKF